ncbi:MAG TPA: hypothetical protein PLV72_03360 [Candidatus Magasanikbacteria bacterium]|nr:hypothetical protein [Candidatus Magasanikbacteria bacterium]
MYKIKIDKLVFGGQGLGKIIDEGPQKGQIVFVWNALPGEVVEADVIKKKKTYIEAVARKILTVSSDRIEAQEEHFHSCSPWQIITSEREREWKAEMTRETYERLADLPVAKIDLVDLGIEYGYRNKMEYSFAEEEEGGRITFGFFERGGRFALAIGDEGCVLADPAINVTAKKVLEWVREQKITKRSLKSLVVRANRVGETVAALFIKDKMEFEDLPELDEKWRGFQVYYSTHMSPSSVPTELLYGIGQDFLDETILGVKMKYGLLSFFQISPVIFEEALKDITKEIPKNADILDFYSGVGAISLPLHDQVRSAVLVDNSEEGIQYANENIMALGAKKYRAECVPAERITDLITPKKFLILDPPRVGLHSDVVRAIMTDGPETIAYLSCNIATQARDIKLLAEKYHVEKLRAYNFFPRTPHVEGLVILKRH